MKLTERPLWQKSLFIILLTTTILGIFGHLYISGKYSFPDKTGFAVSSAASQTNILRIRSTLREILLSEKKTFSHSGKGGGQYRVWISLYDKKSRDAFHGAPYWLQQMGEGSNPEEAVRNALHTLAVSGRVTALKTNTTAIKQDFLKRVRIKLDIETGSAPVLQSPKMLANLSFLYGVDGIRISGNGDKSYYILPSETVEAGIPEVVKGKLRIGVNLHVARIYLHRKYRVGIHNFRFTRFRTKSWIECGRKKTIRPVFRANILIQRKNITRKLVLSAYLSAISNLHQCIDKSGQFRYLYYPIPDREVRTGYSMPRHAGALWMLYRSLSFASNNVLLQDTDRSLHWFLKRTRMDKREHFGRRQNLYDLAIGLLAVLERRRVTGKTNLDPTARAMANHIVRLQDHRGMLHYSLPVKPKLTPRKSLPYAPGEAMLALGRAFRVFKKQAYIKTVRKGMRFIHEKVWSYFGSRLFYGFFAWEQQVIGENWKTLNNPNLHRFSYNQADSYLNYQYTKTWAENRDLLGAFHETVARIPKAAHSGSRGEGIVGSYVLARESGRKDLAEKYKKALQLSVCFILNQQVRPENSYYYRNPEKAMGAIRYTPSYHELRIDHTQHCASVLEAALLYNFFD